MNLILKTTSLAERTPCISIQDDRSLENKENSMLSFFWVMNEGREEMHTISKQIISPSTVDI